MHFLLPSIKCLAAPSWFQLLPSERLSNQIVEYSSDNIVGGWRELPNIWLTATKNAFVSWALNFGVRMLLKSSVIYVTTAILKDKSRDKKDNLDQLRKNFLKPLQSSQSDSSLINIILLKITKKLLIRVDKSSLLPTEITIYFMFLAGYFPKRFLWFLRKDCYIAHLHVLRQQKHLLLNLTTLLNGTWQNTQSTIVVKKVYIRAKCLLRPVLISGYHRVTRQH